MSVSNASPEIFDHIPIIDLSALGSPVLKERQQLAKEIFTACTQVGFFYIKVCFFPSRLDGGRVPEYDTESWNS